MKHATLALLLALSLVVGLSGCGRKDTTGGNDNDILGDNTTGNGSSIDNGNDYGGLGGSSNGTNGSTNNPAGGGSSGSTNGGMNGSSSNGTTGGSDGEGMLQGRSFQEMLEDGRVTDDDGDLHNDEHSTSR